MKLPFISRVRHERELAIVIKTTIENNRGRTVVYFPTEYPKNEKGKKVKIPPEGYCSGPRELWAFRKEFKDYTEYMAYLKSDEYLKGIIPKKKKVEK